MTTKKVRNLISKKRKATATFSQIVSILDAYSMSTNVSIEFINNIHEKISNILSQKKMSQYEKLLINAYYTSISVNKDLMRLDYSVVLNKKILN